MTDRYAVLGHPVAHSRSPFIHAEFARQTTQALVYGRLECPLDGFAAALRGFADGSDGGHGSDGSDGSKHQGEGAARGCNVTVPFKFEALALAPRHTARAALAGAANTLRFDAEGWLADNTDGVGLVRDIEANAGFALAGRRVLLVGAGGAGAGVLGPLLAARPDELVLANRSVDKARALTTRHAGWAAQHGVRLAACGLEKPGSGFDLVVNASASSLQGAAAPVPAAVLRPGTLAVDLMYGAAAAPFLAWAQTAGADARDGLGMLVEQAAEAFFVWRGVRPDTAPVLQALRAAVEAG
jgi:shikimate dehydrogenase